MGAEPFQADLAAGCRLGGLRPSGMLFVRCKGGVSQNPLESIIVEDCATGLAALVGSLRNFRIS